jgi:hypothetical protein
MCAPRCVAVTLVDQPAQFVEANVAAVLFLQRATHPVAAGGNGENERFEARAIVVIERAIDEAIDLAAQGRRPLLVV